MSDRPENSILAQAEQAIESKLTPEIKFSYQKVVNAGMSLGLQNGPHGLLGRLAQSRDPVSDAAKGALGLVFIMRGEAKGVMPPQVIAPAAMTLMIKALAVLDRAGVLTVTNDELVRGARILTDELMARMGVTKPMLLHAATRVHQFTQDPTAMELINRKAGLVKHPDASEPTPVPGATSGLMNASDAAAP